MDFKDIFKAPFSSDYGLYCFDADKHICLEYNSENVFDEHIVQQIADILNDKPSKFNKDINKATVVKNATDCFVMFEDGDVITVRGWGYLTGVLHLSGKDAAKIQDDFLDFIVNKIKESNNEVHSL